MSGLHDVHNIPQLVPQLVRFLLAGGGGKVQQLARGAQEAAHTDLGNTHGTVCGYFTNIDH